MIKVIFHKVKDDCGETTRPYIYRKRAAKPSRTGNSPETASLSSTQPSQQLFDDGADVLSHPLWICVWSSPLDVIKSRRNLIWHMNEPRRLFTLHFEALRSQLIGNWWPYGLSLFQTCPHLPEHMERYTALKYSAHITKGTSWNFRTTNEIKYSSAIRCSVVLSRTTLWWKSLWISDVCTTAWYQIHTRNIHSVSSSVHKFPERVNKGKGMLYAHRILLSPLLMENEMWVIRRKPVDNFMR